MKENKEEIKKKLQSTYLRKNTLQKIRESKDLEVIDYEIKTNEDFDKLVELGHIKIIKKANDDIHLQLDKKSEKVLDFMSNSPVLSINNDKNHP